MNFIEIYDFTAFYVIILLFKKRRYVASIITDHSHCIVHDSSRSMSLRTSMLKVPVCSVAILLNSTVEAVAASWTFRKCQEFICFPLHKIHLSIQQPRLQN